MIIFPYPNQYIGIRSDSCTPPRRLGGLRESQGQTGHNRVWKGCIPPGSYRAVARLQTVIRVAEVSNVRSSNAGVLGWPRL